MPGPYVNNYTIGKGRLYFDQFPHRHGHAPGVQVFRLDADADDRPHRDFPRSLRLRTGDETEGRRDRSSDGCGRQVHMRQRNQQQPRDVVRRHADDGSAERHQRFGSDGDDRHVARSLLPVGRNPVQPRGPSRLGPRCGQLYRHAVLDLRWSSEPTTAWM